MASFLSQYLVNARCTAPTNLSHVEFQQCTVHKTSSIGKMCMNKEREERERERGGREGERRERERESE